MASPGYNDVFVTRLNPAGNTLGYSTYLGGSEGDFGYDVAVDSTGSAYVIGSTESNDFPTKTPYQTYRGPVGTVDVFVTRFTPAGNSLAYSTYLGGTDGNDEGTSIAIDASGSAFLTGYIGSSDFPTQNAFQTNLGGGTFDAFVTKLGAGGNSLTYSTYLGGGDSDQGMNIAIDNEGNAYVAGSTRSYDFPTRNPYQGTFNDVRDAFITKVSPKCCLGMRGNINMTGIIDLTDLSYLILYLTTLPTPTLLCPEAANIDGQGLIDLTDLSWLILYMTTLPTPTLPNCP